MSIEVREVHNIRAFELTRRIRGFEVVADEHRTQNDLPIMPKRGTGYSAGYDFTCNEDVFLRPGEERKIHTDIKAYMEPDEYLAMYPRSSMGNKGLMLKNTVAIVDADYYDNETTGGNIMLLLYNYGKDDLYIQKDTRIVQGIFTKYMITDNDETTTVRKGGFGHTGA